MEIIDGNAVAKSVHAELCAELAQIKQPRPPCVAFIRVGEDPASVSYVRKKERVAGEIGITSRLHVMPESTSQKELNDLIDSLNADDCVDAILIQAPLPKQLNERATFNRVRADKDVDGFSPTNMGLLAMNAPRTISCTPFGVMKLLASTGQPLAGKRAVVIGRSNTVGKPMAMLLLNADCTVTVCHSKTENLAEITSKADILVAAIGRPKFVTADMVKDGAIVIDVGINRVDGKLVGDVDFENVEKKASFITPVPGGVGPMTITMLLANTLQAAEAKANK